MLSCRMAPCVQRPFTATAPCRLAAPAVSRRALSVVALKPSKAADFRTLSDEEVVRKVLEVKKSLASVRFIQRTRGMTELKPGAESQPDPEKIPKGHLNKHYRRQVAQLLTVIRERQTAEGMDAKDAKKVKKSLRVAIGAVVL